MKPVNNKYLDKNNNEIIEEKNEPIDTKEYVLSKLKIFNDVGFYKEEKHIPTSGKKGKVIIPFYFINSLNGHKLYYTWHIWFNFSRFNVKEVNDKYGKYLIIYGGFNPNLQNGIFDIGFMHSKCILFKKNEFNEKLFKKKKKNLLFSQDIDDCKYIMTGYPYKKLYPFNI